MDSQKNMARIAGLLYLIVIICAGFSEGYVRESLIVAGNSAATAENILASEGLFRLGFASDLVAFLSDAVIAILFYVLLKPVSKTLSLVAASLRLIAHPAIGSINLLNHWNALLLLGGTGPTAFTTEQLQSLAMVSLEAHGTGYLIAGVFFGLHCFLLGYLLYKSDYFPKTLGVLLAIAAFGYLAESFGTFLLPGNEELFTWIVTVTAVAAEVPLCLWLVVKGIKSPAGAV